jgi:ribose 5-phosphate isomerase B
MCGSGIGMSIAANRFDGVRATLCEDEERTELARRHNNSNILVLPGRYLGTVKAARMVDIWLETDFDGGRHSRRVEKIDK